MILLIGLVVLVYVGLALSNYIRMRGTRIITCPENKHPAAVTVDAAHAAMTAVWESPAGLLAMAGAPGVRPGMHRPDRRRAR